MKAKRRALAAPEAGKAEEKMQAFNPYLPSWEYTPDGEPHVFGDRLYVYGSHDRFRGHAYCLNDYVCWSAPTDRLWDWRYEGVIYRKTDDPLNRNGASCLYAPDVTRGPDGRYYLYYALDRENRCSVAVCDSPAGTYTFYGYVHYPDGRPFGEREGEVAFDPGVLTEDGKVWLYTGFCPATDKSRRGSLVARLDGDMLTVVQEPRILAPSKPCAAGTGYEGHEFFEASSIRKFGDTYYFVYSSVVMHELCYATSVFPDRDFRYRGVLVSNADLGIDSYKPADMPAFYGANNHGGLVQIDGETYVFYHRHTDGTNFSRQGLAERVVLLPDGSIPQVEMTSCGLNGGPLVGKGTYPAYIASNLFTDVPHLYTGGSGDNGFWLGSEFPRVTQDGKDGDEEPGFLMNLVNGSTCGFKYFDFQNVRELRIRARGYCNGDFEVRTAWNGDVLGKIHVSSSTIWMEYGSPVSIPNGVGALYLSYRGSGCPSLLDFTLV